MYNENYKMTTDKPEDKVLFEVIVKMLNNINDIFQ